MEQLIHLDAQLLLYLNSMHCAFFDSLMWGLTSAKVWVPMYMVLVWVLFKQYGITRAFWYSVAMVLCCFAWSEMMCGHIIREWIARPRPTNAESPIWQLIHTVNDYRGGHYGFPSCHAANSFGLAMAVSLLVRRRSTVVWMYVWASIHTYTRIYLGVHYPGDIIVGIIIGSLGSYLIYKIFEHYKLVTLQRTFPYSVALPATGTVILFGILVYAVVCQL